MTASGFDVAVVGAGIVGAATAAELARRGARVCLLDRGEVSGGTTGLGEGNVLVSNKDIGPELELTLHGLRMYDELDDRLGPVARICRKGALIMHPDAATWAAEPARIARLRAAGVHAELLTPEQAREREPALTGQIHGAAYGRPPVRPTRALAATPGIDLRTHCEVHAVLTSGATAPIGNRGPRRDGAGRLRPGGPRRHGAGRLRPGGPRRHGARRLRPGGPRRHGARVRRPGGRARDRGRPRRLRRGRARGWRVDGAARRIRRPRAPARAAQGPARPVARGGPRAAADPAQGRGGLLPAFGREPGARPPDHDGAGDHVGRPRLVGSSRERRGFDTAVDPEVSRAMLERATRLMPSLAALEADSAWAGLRPWLPDGAPAIGPSAAAQGHEGAGVALGPVTGRLVAQALCGEAPLVDLAAFSPDRFG